MLKGTGGEDGDPGLVELLLQWRRRCDSESGTATPEKTWLPVTCESRLGPPSQPSKDGSSSPPDPGAGCLPPLPLPSVSSLCGFRWDNTVNFFLGSSSIQMHGNSEKGDGMAEADVLKKTPS